MTFFAKSNGGIIVRTDYIFKEELKHVLATLTPPNRLVLEICLATGLRLSDVLSLRTSKLANRMTVRELKTGKTRRVFINNELLIRAQREAGRIYVFEHRLDPTRHRTRQAVWKDIKRSAKLLRIKYNIAPHTTRKVYAVAEYHRTGDLKRVQRLLNHNDASVTAIYAFADELTARRTKRRGKRQ